LLRLRLLSAAILITAVSTLLVLDATIPIAGVPGLWLLPAGLFIVVGTAWEFAVLTKSAHNTEPFWVSIATGCIFLLSAAPLFYDAFSSTPYPADCLVGRMGWPLIGGLVACSVFCIFAMRRFSELLGRTIEYWALSNLICVYVGVGGAFFLLVRQLTPSWWGLFCLIVVIAIPKFGDAGAFFVGRSFGKRKLCPSISPGKTVAGAVGALITSGCVSIVAFVVIAPWIAAEPIQLSLIPMALVFGIILAVVGLIGDLAESLVKRSMDAKDSGGLLPGLGGVWDVSDSLLPTIVTGHIMLALELLTPPGAY
jgi:phosphatidate cytidylyltransferase